MRLSLSVRSALSARPARAAEGPEALSGGGLSCRPVDGGPVLSGRPAQCQGHAGGTVRTAAAGAGRSLTFFRPGDIVSAFKVALTETRPPGGAQRGARLLQVPCVTRMELTTPEPPGMTGPGLSRYRKARAARDLCRHSPLRCHARTLRDGQLFHAPPKMPPGFSRPVFRSARVTVALLPGVPHFSLARGWNRGIRFRISPLIFIRGEIFFFTPNTRR